MARSFWRPLTASQYLAFAGQVPADFRFVVKCPSVVTDAQVRDEDGKGMSLNPVFLQPDLAVASFVEPTLEGLGERLGVLVFQLSPMTWGLLSRPTELLARLQAMLEAVRAALRQCGKVQKEKLLPAADGNARAAFVDFQSATSADAAVALTGAQIDGVAVEVSRSRRTAPLGARRSKEARKRRRAQREEVRPGGAAAAE